MLVQFLTLPAVSIHAHDDATVAAHLAGGGKRWTIYVVTEVDTGRQYVGQTYTTVEERWEAHCNPYSQCRKLRDAIQARGKEQFGIKPLVVNIITQEEANECEKKHMIFC